MGSTLGLECDRCRGWCLVLYSPSWALHTQIHRQTQKYMHSELLCAPLLRGTHFGVNTTAENTRRRLLFLCFLLLSFIFSINYLLVFLLYAKYFRKCTFVLSAFLGSVLRIWNICSAGWVRVDATLLLIEPPSSTTWIMAAYMRI